MKEELGNRMKEYYENISQTKLIRRTPVAIRIDGKAFHTFTRGFKKPFDEVLIRTMQETTKYLCENIQGCVLGYTQSDEITLILIDYQKLNTSAWFDYKVQKMCSVAASMATVAFNKFLKREAYNYDRIIYTPIPESLYKVLNFYVEKAELGATFDARCFNIPEKEVANLIYWRQLDATRNSIQMVGQAYFSHKELQGKSCNEIQDMLFTQKGINWNDFQAYKKRGSCVVKKEQGWKIDKNIPIFKNEGREYINKLIFIESES